MLVLEWKEIAFIEKVNFGCFCWFPTAILVHQSGAPILRLHTKLYKVVWNILANTSYSETVGHKDLRLGQIVCMHELVFYNISFSWLLPLDGPHFIFLQTQEFELISNINFNTLFWLLLVPDPCSPLEKHSFLLPFSLLKNWGDCLFCGGGGWGEMLFRFALVPIKRYSHFSFFFIQNCKRWEGGWFWSYFFRVIFFWWGGGPESRVQSPESSARSSPGLRYAQKMTWQVDKATQQISKTTEQVDRMTQQGEKTIEQVGKMTQQIGKTTEKVDKTMTVSNRQDDRTSRQEDTTNRQDDRTSRQDHMSNRQDDRTRN